MAVGTRMQQRRATAAQWNTSSYVLAPGEIGVTTDTNIFKVGNGTSAWVDLPIALNGQYLPLLGTAANAALLGGVSVDSLVKIADTDVNPTNNTYVKRTADGGVRVSDATENIEAVSLQQATSLLAANKQLLISRTLTAAGNLALTDIGKMIVMNTASSSSQSTVTIPLNSTVAFPIGSWVDICCSSPTMGAKILAAAGVTINGAVNVMPGYGVIRVFKTATDTWQGIQLDMGKIKPRIKVTCATAGQSFASATFVQFDTLTSEGYNPDAEWFSIPGTGLSTARRIICNKDGEYTFNANFSYNGSTLMWGSIWLMTADNSTTGGQSKGVQTLQPTGSVTFTRRVTAGQSFGARVTGGSGNTGRADLEATGGDPVSLIITRIGD